MGKAKKGDSLNFSGKIGNKVYVQRKNGTVVVYEAPATPSIPQRTEAQLQHRRFQRLRAVQHQRCEGVHSEAGETERRKRVGSVSDYAR